ncbi:hypothetical protein RHGRI_008332 [Rhododendron griersonianum]|uniref:SHSP domain-containing protein n=1 Tax=Rhododendron griersonianum TaxID=479676 RepID=A0AAV6L145_9ERIC|nr:hypothetical protein RHGRI_008332 [Rhododendron griersonianum]
MVIPKSSTLLTNGVLTSPEETRFPNLLLPKSLGTTRQAILASRLFKTCGTEDEFIWVREPKPQNDFSLVLRGHYERNPFYVPPREQEHLADMSDSFFSTNTSLGERLKMMDKFMDSPYRHAITYRGILPGRWEARETDDGFYIRMYMPGLAKENVYITGEHNYMIIGEVSSNKGRAWRISTTIDLPPKFYKSDQIKAEMKNGVLNIVVLKSEKEERDEEFHVNVEAVTKARKLKELTAIELTQLLIPKANGNPEDDIIKIANLPISVEKTQYLNVQAIARITDFAQNQSPQWA